ncbi:MAG: EamA family transporter [Chloroflexi bacterium]|nr:EamA family transporter [Chloroflexota bacterium]
MLACPDERGRWWLPHLLLFVVVLIWSSNTVVSKLILRDVAPAPLALVRFSIAVLTFHVPIFVVLLRVNAPLKQFEWQRIAVIGLVGVGTSGLLYTLGLDGTPATYAALMQMTGPPIAVIVSWLVFRETLGAVRALGTAIAFGGAAVLATNGQLAAPDTPVLVGSSLIMLSQLTWAIYTIFGKPLLAYRPPLLILSGAHVFALGSLWTGSIPLGAWQALLDAGSWPWPTWVGILYLAFGTTALSQVMYGYALRDVSASQAISYSYLQPPMTAVMAAFTLGEHPTVLTYVCGVAILFGLWLVNRPRRLRPRRLRQPG